jgi:hypothetical protein
MVQRTGSSVFGRVPVGTTHFSLSRKGALGWEGVTHRDRSGWHHQFPIADLSVSLIVTRWGPGTYRASFLSLGRSGEESLGAGRVFEVTPTAGGQVRHPSPQPDDHSEMVRALLHAADGKRSPGELFEALAIPTGMALSALFTAVERLNERLDLIERRLDAPRGRVAAPPEARAAEEDAFERVLAKLESIEQRLPPARRPSPGRRTPSR